MKSLRTLIVLLSFVLLKYPTVTAQTDTTGNDSITFEKADTEASFPGDVKKWRLYLEKTLNPNVPVENGAPNGIYIIVIQFIVDKNGNIFDIKALTNNGFGMEAEAMRVIKKGPKWVPAMKDERVVKSYHKQAFTFIVSGE